MEGENEMLVTKTKDFIAIGCLIVIVSFMLSGCGTKTDSIEFVDTPTSIYVGDSLSLDVIISPPDASNQEVTFITSDQGLAEIDGEYLTALSAGSVTVTAQQDGSDFDSITVEIKPVLPEKIVFEQETIELGISRSLQLSAKLLPENTTDKRITYASSDPSIAQVEGTTLTALAEGTTVITASHESGIMAECAVNVCPVLLEGLTIEGLSSFKINETANLTAFFNPTDVTDKNLKWSTSNKSIISVDNGLIKAKKIGIATITAKHASGITATKEIEVLPILAAHLAINGDETSLYEKESITLSATILPEDTTDKTITWTSDNPNIASVKNGKVTGVSAGTVFITASTSNDIKDTYVITVKSNTKDMKVSVSSRCVSYNSVGNEWGTYFSVNGSQINSGDIVSVKRNSNLSVYTEVIEYDNIPDVGRGSYKFTVTPEYFEDGVVVTQTIYVQENRGRYSGNVATWEVEYEFTPYN